jgi:hypothetical protein
MTDVPSANANFSKRVPWNRGKIVGAKPPLRPKHVWSIRTKLQVEGHLPAHRQLAGSAASPRNDAASIRERLQAGSDVDAAAEQVAATHHHVADMNADAKQHATIRRRALGGVAQCLLRLNRTLHGIHCAWKFREHAVARRIGDTSSVTGDGVVQDRPLGGQHPHRADLVGLRQAAESGYIRGKHGGKSAFYFNVLWQIRAPETRTILAHKKAGRPALLEYVAGDLALPSRFILAIIAACRKLIC